MSGWQQMVVTIVAVGALIGLACISAFVFHEDGKILMGCGIAIVALSNKELRQAIIDYLPRYLPKKKD